MKKYNSIAVLGTQWGDEGKGKITNYLSERADYVVRYQGGNNAGHSIVIEGKRYALHLLPSGILNPKVKNVITNGVVIDLEGMLNELELLKKQGINKFQLFISDRAHVVFPYHKILDGIFEEMKGDRKIGTTKKGIGPAYTDKSAREGIRVIDLFDEELFEKLLRTNIKIKNELLKSLGQKEIDFDETYEYMNKLKVQIKEYVVDTSVLIYEALEKGERVLFEGAQGVLLCLDHGTYPFVTSSSPTSSSIPVNVGIPAWSVTTSLGIVKAYSTRVGTGGFPTEITDEIAHQIREVGNEYGTTTGRPRRIGWFDAVLVRHSARVSGLTDIALTLLDVLTGIDKLKIAINYEINGKETKYVPAGEKDFNNAKPIYVELDGWKEDITKVTSFDELPENAKKYLQAIEKYSGVRVSQFSVGPDRKQTIEINDIF